MFATWQNCSPHRSPPQPNMVGTYPASELLHQQYGLMGSYISEVCFSSERSIIEALLVYLQTDVLASQLCLLLPYSPFLFFITHLWGRIYSNNGAGGGLVAQSCLTLATPWTVTCQAPLSMGFSRQEYWSGLPFPSPEDLPDPGIKPMALALPANSLPLSH